MPNSEEGCIRYLMKEMDPSEEVEFEREMMRDEDLLIEVESLRSTFKKLGKLPLQAPPKHVSEKVLQQAVEAHKKEIHRSNRIVGWLGRSVAAAAVLLLSISAGYQFFGSQTIDNTSTTTSNTVTRSGIVKPWVDRNQVIMVSENQNAIRSQQLDQDYTESYNKLIPVKDGQDVLNQSQPVLLTNSPSNR